MEKYISRYFTEDTNGIIGQVIQLNVLRHNFENSCLYFGPRNDKFSDKLKA